MKILFVISSLQVGGEQRVLSILSDQLVRKNHEVDICVLSKKVEKQFALNRNVHVNYLNINGVLKNFVRVVSIRKQARREKYDVVIGFAVIPSILCSFATIGVAPAVVCERNDPMIYSTLLKFVRSVAYRFCAGAVFQTNDASECFPTIKRRAIIHNPLNTSAIPERCTGTRNMRIVNTSRLVPQKNHKMLIDAFRMIATKHPEYSLVIYGDGPEKSNLQQYITDISLGDRIHILPARTDILDVIREDSVFVLSSNHEGFPNSLAEALAMGIPSISTDCRIGGPREMIEDGVNGYLVKAGDTQELSEKLDILLSDSAVRESFSKNGYAIRHKLESGIIAEKWISFLRLAMADDS